MRHLPVDGAILSLNKQQLFEDKKRESLWLFYSCLSQNKSVIWELLNQNNLLKT